VTHISHTALVGPRDDSLTNRFRAEMIDYVSTAAVPPSVIAQKRQFFARKSLKWSMHVVIMKIDVLLEPWEMAPLLFY
jgi:hypothetical protein